MKRFIEKTYPLTLEHNMLIYLPKFSNILDINLNIYTYHIVVLCEVDDKYLFDESKTLEVIVVTHVDRVLYDFSFYKTINKYNAVLNTNIYDDNNIQLNIHDNLENLYAFVRIVEPTDEIRSKKINKLLSS